MSRKIQGKRLHPNSLNRFVEEALLLGSRYPWGDEKCNPACPYGAQVWNETGPVRIQDLNLSDRQDLGFEDAVTDKSGYRVIGYMNQSVTQGELKSFHREMPAGLKEFMYDLYWQDTKLLKLTIFHPMGRWDRTTMRATAGRMAGSMSKFPGRMVHQPEDWYAVVEGEHVKGTQQFHAARGVIDGETV